MVTLKDDNPILATATEFAILEAVRDELDARYTELDELHEELKHKIGQAREEDDTVGAELFSKLAVVVRTYKRKTSILNRAVYDLQDDIVEELRRRAGEFDDDDTADKQNKPA